MLDYRVWVSEGLPPSGGVPLRILETLHFFQVEKGCLKFTTRLNKLVSWVWQPLQCKDWERALLEFVLAMAVTPSASMKPKSSFAKRLKEVTCPGTLFLFITWCLCISLPTYNICYYSTTYDITLKLHYNFKQFEFTLCVIVLGDLVIPLVDMYCQFDNVVDQV